MPHAEDAVERSRQEPAGQRLVTPFIAFVMQHAEIMLSSCLFFPGNRGLRVSGKMSCVDWEK